MKTTHTFLKLLLATGVLYALNGCDHEVKTTEDNLTLVTDTNVTTPTVSPRTLLLHVDRTTLNKEDNTTLSVMATYADNSTKELSDVVTWVMTPAQSLVVDHTTLIAHKDGNLTLQAKVGNTLSNRVNLNVSWVVNGHVLPPEPDPTINNSTLLLNK